MGVRGGIRINAADSQRNTNGVNASYTEQYTSPTFRKGMPRNLTRDSCPSPDSDKNECVTRISFSKRNRPVIPVPPILTSGFTVATYDTINLMK